VKKIVIYGGTFDPVHSGHIACAEEVIKYFGMDALIFIPSGNPPHKIAARVTPGAFRVEMLKLASAEIPNVYVSDEEVTRQGYTYTVDTLRWLHGELAKKLGGEEYKLYFIVGTDVLRDLHKWKDYETVFSLCEFIAVKRPGEDNSKFDGYKQYAESLGAVVHNADLVLREISSSEIRSRIDNYESLDGLVPSNVEKFIAVNRLYRHSSAASKAEIKADLKERLTEEKYLHSLGVMEECERLAELYGADKKKCSLAGLVHDCAKSLTGSQIGWIGFSLDELKKTNPYCGTNPRVVHAFTGRILAEKRYGIRDIDVLTAVETHVTGRPDMSLISSIVFIADYTEKNREGEVFEKIRKVLNEEGLYKAIQVSCESTMAIVSKRGEELDINTVLTRNWAIIKQKEIESRKD